MKWRTLIAVTLMVLAAGLAAADELVLFDAAQAGPDIWAWGGAKVTAQAGKLLIQRAVKLGRESDVFVEERFPYFEDAAVAFDAERILSGTYTLQLLAFRGESYLKSIDLARDSIQLGAQAFRLKDLSLPPETDTVTFKVWVSDQEGSGVLLNNLRYYTTVSPDTILCDIRITPAARVETDRTDWTVSPDVGVLKLLPGEDYGSILFTDIIPRPENAAVMVLGEAHNGTMTVQLACLDENGEYLDSVDAADQVTTSVSRRIDAVPWPDGTTGFRIKIWIGGSQAVSATLRRIVLLR